MNEHVNKTIAAVILFSNQVKHTMLDRNFVLYLLQLIFLFQFAFRNSSMVS